MNLDPTLLRPYAAALGDEAITSLTERDRRMGTEMISMLSGVFAQASDSPESDAPAPNVGTEPVVSDPGPSPPRE